jgi:CRISPR/Cas system CSM-associated protein Csm2 small subunit
MKIEKKKIEIEKKDNEIIYSKAIKAGKRIYYLDVKKSRSEELFLAITESKKKVVGSVDDMQVTYEKHKIFLYKEDFGRFIEGLKEVVSFIEHEQGESISRYEESTESTISGEPKSKSFFGKFKF